MDSTSSLPTSSTRERISELASEPATGFTQEEIDRSVTFFARLVTIYGKARARTLWGESEAQYQLLRREWAHTLGKFSHEQLEEIFSRLKQRLATGDPDFKFPDVARILNLLREGEVRSAHRVFPRGLPEPEWKREKRLAVGRVAAQTTLAVLKGKACLLEDRPSG